MRTALLLIATGEKYWQYINPLLASARAYFIPHNPILWTDYPEMRADVNVQLFKKPVGYPNETLYRYHTFLEQRGLLEPYDYIFYCDIDMLFAAPITEDEILSDGITATLHPGYIGGVGTPDRNVDSMAFLPLGIRNKYFCGGFNGGTTESFLKMAREIKRDVDDDTSRNVMAVWHDESHLNRYLYDNPPARILGPEFCYPEGCQGVYAGHQIGEPKLIALTKDNR